MAGKSLPLVTHDFLVKHGMTSGPALNVVSHIQKLFGKEKTDPPSMFSIP